MKEATEVAAQNLRNLAHNRYPGRGIVIGQGSNGDFYQVYWVMGRSPNSQNRRFVEGPQAGSLLTASVDPEKVEDASLLIYRAMAEMSGVYVVSNGSQTDTIMRDLSSGSMGLGISGALQNTTFEPDAPHFTPRITGVLWHGQDRHRANIEFVMLRQSRLYGGCDRLHYTFGLMPGFGYCLHTYLGEANPLPAFEGESYLLPLNGDDIAEVGDNFWATLDESYRVCLAVKQIDLRTGLSSLYIINRFEPAPAQSTA